MLDRYEIHIHGLYTATNPTEYLGFPVTNTTEYLVPLCPSFPVTNYGNVVSAGGFSIMGLSNSKSISTSEIVTGSHVLCINGYSSQIKGLGNGKSISSSTFCLGGHRWFITCYPNGNCVANADWISVFLKYENTDAVDVKARMKFSVVDDIGEPVPLFSKESSAIFSPNHRIWGFHKFVLRKSLDESSYLKDDCLKVRCDVTISKATTQFVDVPPSNIYQHFGSLLSGKVGADVTFEVAGEMFAAHRCVLAARSPVFLAELFGSMKEKTMSCIQIHDMEASVFKDMLHFIYTDTLPDIDKGDVIIELLLVAADRYDLKRLKLICEDKLCKSIDTSTVASTLVLAEQHDCHGLKKACLEFLKSPCHLKTVMATNGFDHLMATCPSLIKELLAKVANCP